MADRVTTRRERTFIWIPPENTCSWKLTVEGSDDVEEDISSIVSILNIEDGVTESLGSFSFEIWNPNETYTGKWRSMDTVRFYADRAATATTLRFQGRIDKPSYRGMKMKVIGQSESARLTKVTVTKSYTSATCDDILKDLISNYATAFTDTNIEASTETLTIDWYQTPFWDCVATICKAATTSDGKQFDCYVDSTLDFHFFERGSRQNLVEGINHQINLMGIGDFTEDSSDVINRVIIYGAITDGIQVLYTAEDTDSQDEYDKVSELVINDNDITTEAQAKEFAEWKLEDFKNAPIVGEVSGVFLGTLQPGESIPLSSPPDNITPGIYDVVGYKHQLGEKHFQTTVNLKREIKKTGHIFKKLIEKQNQAQETSLNPEEMRYSYNHRFDDDSGTHSNTEITDGVLKLTGAVGTGNWISSVKNHGSNITEAYLILVGETLTGATVQVSNDGGVTYSTITNKNKITFTTTGSNIRVKVSFNNLDTQVDSMSIQYK